MYNGNSILVTVCARGGSKSVKNKNIRLLNNRPLIWYSLDLVKGSRIVDGYIVSTDSDDIAKAVKDYGFNTYFKRPAYLAKDKVSRLEAIKHAVLWAEKKFKKRYDIISDLGVATPLKILEDLENSIKLLIETKASNILSVTPSRRNPYYNMVEIIDGKVCLVKKLKRKITDRKDAPEVYDMNDGVYVWRRDVLFSDAPIFNTDTKLYAMPNSRSVDIDEEFDYCLAEFLVNRFAGVTYD